MTCKDCYHSDVCGFEQCDSGALTFCENFRDKSLIIELPMSVTDKLKKELINYCYERCIDEL